jgi:hypothetical protein
MISYDDKNLLATNLNQLPADVEEANQDVEVLRRAASVDKSAPAYPRTTMSTFIHLLRLKMIESDIQHNIYRVDKPSVSKSIHQSTDSFLERLYAWRDAIPPQSKKWGPADRHRFRGDEYMSYDSYVSSSNSLPLNRKPDQQPPRWHHITKVFEFCFNLDCTSKISINVT